MEQVTSLDDLPLRTNLQGLTPYGAPQLHVPVALNVNENTHPVPEAVARDILADLAEAIRTVNRYPDREFTALREALARYLGEGLIADNIWAGARSADLSANAAASIEPLAALLANNPEYQIYVEVFTDSRGEVPIAATKMDSGTDVNFGNVSRKLLACTKQAFTIKHICKSIVFSQHRLNHDRTHRAITRLSSWNSFSPSRVSTLLMIPVQIKTK